MIITRLAVSALPLSATDFSSFVVLLRRSFRVPTIPIVTTRQVTLSIFFIVSYVFFILYSSAATFKLFWPVTHFSSLPIAFLWIVRLYTPSGSPYPEVRLGEPRHVLRNTFVGASSRLQLSVYSLSPIIPTLRPKSTIQLFSYHQNSLQFCTKQSIAMRLLHAESIQLRSFEENAIPRYAILSHTWGEDEVSFQDLYVSAAASKTGYQKIKYICEHALAHRLQYVWVDTCCIDKTSSAELSEAINSMFRWYRNAEYCYAYLADVPDLDVTGAHLEQPASAFHSSRWFTRGWTLQELLAPADFMFFSSGGREIGTKLELSEDISSITSIDKEYLTRTQPLSQASIAKRMSWVSRRKTTRIEDLAYCLLGIFDISMPLLYGEGDKAFFRLQEEIMKTSGDQSLFAWGYNHVDLQSYKGRLSSETSHGPFAEHPAQFKHSGHIIPDELEPPTSASTLTNMGLQMNIRIVEHLSRFQCAVAILACRPEDRWLWLIGIALRSHSEDSFTRLGLNTRLLLRRDEVVDTPYRPVRFLTNPLHLRPPAQPPQRSIANKYSCLIRKVPSHFASGGLSIWNVEPRDAWEPDQRMISLSANDDRHIVLRLWRKKGDGYVIILERVTTYGTRDRKWEYCVYREDCDQPRSYDFYSKYKRCLPPRSIDLVVYQGKQVIQTKEFCDIISVIDIEVSEGAIGPICESEQLLKKTMISSQDRLEMAHGRMRPLSPQR
jgi:hypothetical protein